MDQSILALRNGSGKPPYDLSWVKRIDRFARQALADRPAHATASQVLPG